MIINSSIKKYKVSFYSEFFESLLDYREGDVIIIDKNVPYLNTELTRNIIEIEATENTKSYDFLPNIIDKILSTSFSRENKLIAIGGGVTQDVTSFISSVLFRGVDWIFFPTTLLAQGDSCIGGKTSLNFRNYKNQLGNFNPPNRVVVCESFLATLSEKEIKSGLGEMLHFYLVSSSSDFEFYKKHYKLSKHKIIKRCLEIKKGFIEIDEFDKGRRLLLNYGHTFGHAIESTTNYAYPHGISVCFGMDIANFISMKMGYLAEDTYRSLKEFIYSVHTTDFDMSIDIEYFISALKKDKKNNKADNINCVLTKGVGNMLLTNVEINKIRIYLQEYGFNK